jgi:L-malate glycosyltransferase
MAPACKDRMITIPNMVDTEFFVPPGHSPPGPFTFFCLAHLEAGKGIDTLLEATRILLDRKARPVRVVIGGDGPQRSRLEKMARELSLETTITFTGVLGREEVRDNLQKSHAFVLPSRFEAFGVVYIEAMACGLPVIATKAGGPIEFVSKDTGLLVEADQAPALEAAMDGLMQRHGDYKPDRIRETVTRRFGKEVVTKSYVALYQQLIEKTRKHG